MKLRQDLLELSTEALLALANAGFVKRAQKDVAAGLLPVLRQDEDGSVHASFDDGVQTSIAASDSLRTASCTCPATSMCRHRISLVLAYQAQHAVAKDAAGDTEEQLPQAAAVMENSIWSPADFDDAAILACFGNSVLEQALRLAATRPLATVFKARAGADGMTAPAVQLPMSYVRFFSRSSLAHARCDCQQGSGCAHIVLASWAFRLATAKHPEAAEVNLEVLPHGQVGSEVHTLLQQPQAQASLAAMQHFLLQLWHQGSAQPLLGLEASYASLQDGLQVQGWTWLSLAFDKLWQHLQAQAHRSSRFDALDLLDATAQCWARVLAAMQADGQSRPRLPASQILGLGQKGEVPLDMLRLVSLGSEFWRDDMNEGVSLVFADPDTQTVSVLERCWELTGKEESHIHGILSRRIANLPVRQLASSQIISKAAKRRANAAIELGSNARQTNALALSPRSWDDIKAPLKFSQLPALLAHLRQRPPACISPALLGAHWKIMEMGELELQSWSWDGAKQTLFAHWKNSDGDSLCWYLAYQQLTAGAVDALACALSGLWGRILSVAGPVWLEHGGAAMTPMSLMTEQRAVVLALEANNPQKMDLQQIPLPSSDRHDLLHESRHLLGLWLRQGLHQTTAALRSRLQAQATALAAAGFAQTASLMQTALADLGSGQNRHELDNLSSLVLLLAELQS